MHLFEFYHGAALLKIIKSNKYKKIELLSNNNSVYLIDDKYGLYIKYSQKRISPWVFTFDKVHIDEISEVYGLLKNVYIVLICHDDGICCLNWQEFNTVLSIQDNIYPKWIKAIRKINEKYSVFGSDGNLQHKIGISDFPDKLSYDKSIN